MRRLSIVSVAALMVLACGENGPDFSVQAVVTVSPTVAGYSCEIRWQGFASDSTTRADVSLFEMYSDSTQVLVPLGPNVYQRTFHGNVDISWAGGVRPPPDLTALRWMVWENGTVLIQDDTAAVQGWPSCATP